MKYVVHCSGGKTSFWALKCAIEQKGKENVFPLFADTKYEDADLYRFLTDQERLLGIAIIRVSDGRTPWGVFRDEGLINVRAYYPCSGMLKKEQIDGWIAANMHEPFVHVFGMNWHETNRMDRLAKVYGAENVWFPLADKPYVENDDISAYLTSVGIAEPYLYTLGFDHNNCFQGDEKFITKNGLRSFRETVDTQVQVLSSDGYWHDAEVHSFGMQPLVELRLVKNGKQKIIRTTMNHRWFTYEGDRGTRRKEKQTHELQAGDKLCPTHPRVKNGVRPSAFGIAHGITFGDGTKNTSDTSFAFVMLCGEKQELGKFFPLSPSIEAPGVGTKYSDLPRSYKNLPSKDEGHSYLLGWLMGYFATDGSITKNGDTVLSSAQRQHLEYVHDICLRLGIGVGTIQEERRQGYGENISSLYTLRFVRSTIPSDFFLRSYHNQIWESLSSSSSRPVGWTVDAIIPCGIEEEVFCCVVPDTHNFVLEDYILTGNCGGRCVKAGIGHWKKVLELLPERYAEVEAEELSFQHHIGKKVTILKDRSKGQFKPMSLTELREKVQAKPSFGGNDVEGGCGCYVASILDDLDYGS